jgi:hypothetical protein
MGLSSQFGFSSATNFYDAADSNTAYNSEVPANLIDNFRWWRSLRRNKTLRAWIEEVYKIDEIKRMAIESTDCDLHQTWNPHNPPGERTLEQWWDEEADWQRAVKRLYCQYGDEIWYICLSEGQAGIDKLTSLDLADQINGPRLFEEFMVRNALKLTAIQILKDKGLPIAS